MKKLAQSTAILALALAASSALAADLPSYKAPPPPPPPPPPMWTGFYVGLNAGYTWANSNNVWTNAFPIDNDNESPFVAATVPFNLAGNNNGGFIGGGQVGYNYQFASSFVVGLEADIQGVASSNSFTSGFGAGFVPANDLGVTFMNASRRLDYLGTVRGRVGWLFTPTLLLYGTGGLAYGGVNLTTSLMSAELLGAAFVATDGVGFGAAAFSDTRVGWTAGGGVEWMFWPNWSAKVEYLYYDLGSVTLPSAVVIGVSPGGAQDWAYAASTRTRFDGHVVRAGLNYHFNWGAPAPVYAKY